MSDNSTYANPPTDDDNLTYDKLMETFRRFKEPPINLPPKDDFGNDWLLSSMHGQFSISPFSNPASILMPDIKETLMDALDLIEGELLANEMEKAIDCAEIEDWLDSLE